MTQPTNKRLVTESAQATALAVKAPINNPTFTGTVSGVTKSMVGLGSVDNTADSAKPVSTAQQTALDLKAPLASPTFTGTVSGVTKSHVGLGNVDNTSDVNKPVSTAQQTALNLKVAKGELVYRVKDYGATGDGSTDDATNINACLTAARTARPFTTQRPKVLFDMGIYIIGAVLNCAGLVIEGYGATVKSKASITGFNMLQAFNGSVSIYGLTIDANKANTTAPGTPTSNACAIYTHQATGGLIGEIRDVTVINCHGPALRISSTTDASDSFNALSTPAHVINLTTDGCLNGVWINGGRNVTISYSHFYNSGAEAVWWNISRSITVDHCVVDTTGVTVANSQGIADFYSYGSRITNNYVRNTKFAGICIGGGSTTLVPSRKFTIANNICENNDYHGITIDPTKSNALFTSQVCYGTITGNVCEANGFVATNGNGIYVHNAAEVTVTGNECANNYWSGVVLDGLRLSASGNVCTGNGLYGIELRKDSSSTDHGYYSIAANTLVNNTTQNLFISTLLTTLNTVGIVYTADIEVADSTKGTILQSPNGTRWRITVGNDGALTTTGL